MAVFPQSMSRIDPSNPEEAVRVIESYVRYMQERIEFSITNVTRSVASAPMSSAEMYVLLKELQNTVAAMASAMQGVSREVVDMKNDVGDAMAAARDAGDYEKNTNKPKINGTELVGSLTNEDIHIRELTNAEIQRILNK